MQVSPSAVDQEMDLPPLYSLVALREVGDAHAHACAIAENRGAGTLVWVRRYDLVEFAVVLEPEEPLAEARRAIYVGSNALADALITHAPPKCPVQVDWPDAIRVDGVLVGGTRLGCPDGVGDDEVPPWLVLSGIVRARAVRATEPGSRPYRGALDELGFEEIDTGKIIESFARHLLHGFDGWRNGGFAEAAKHWIERFAPGKGLHARLDDNGDLLQFREAGQAPVERRELKVALATPSWLDPATRTPWL